MENPTFDPFMGLQESVEDSFDRVPELEISWTDAHFANDLFRDPNTLGWDQMNTLNHRSCEAEPKKDFKARIQPLGEEVERLKKDEAEMNNAKLEDMAGIGLRRLEHIQSVEGQLSTLQKELPDGHWMEGQLIALRTELQTRTRSTTNRIAAALKESHRNRFDKHAVGIFFPDEKCGAGTHGSIAYISPEGKTFYHDVEYFINAARAAGSKIDFDVLRKNLHTCLLGGAQTWYTSVLTDREREDATKGQGIDNWIALLRRRWASSGDQVIADLSNLKFSETAGRQNFTKFVLDVVHLCRRIGINMLYVQLMLAWSRMDPKLQARVGCPREEESIEDFIRKMEVIKRNQVE